MKLTLEEAASALREARSIVLASHENPDGDAIGSCLGLMHALRGMGKEVQVFIDDEIPFNFEILPGCSEIQRPPKPIREKISPELLVVLDATPERIGSVPEFVDAPSIVIDHHVSNKGDDQRLYLDAKRAATCEIIYQLVKELRCPFTEDIAICLYTGIATDTGFFRYASTTPFTMRAVAELMETGIRPNVVSEAMEEKTSATVQNMAKALQTMEIFCGGKAAGIFLDEATSEKIETTEGFIDMVRIIQGVDVAVVLKCKEKDVCRVSMRSKRQDVSRIAMAFDGGGHVHAAGCTLKMPFAEAKRQIVAAIKTALEAAP